MTDFGHRSDGQPDPTPEELERLEADLAALARDVADEDRDLPAPPPELRAAILAAASEPASEPTLRRRPLRPLLAVAALLVVVASASVLAARRDGSTLVASAEIINDGLPVAFTGGGGEAEVRRGDNGLFLRLDLPELPETGGDAYYEAWMIDTSVEGMVSLGAVRGDGRVDLPDGLDHSAFPVVDISLEPLDGDPTHSGQSILRGVLG